MWRAAVGGKTYAQFQAYIRAQAGGRERQANATVSDYSGFTMHFFTQMPGAPVGFMQGSPSAADYRFTGESSPFRVAQHCFPSEARYLAWLGSSQRDVYFHIPRGANQSYFYAVNRNGYTSEEWAELNASWFVEEFFWWDPNLGPRKSRANANQFDLPLEW